MSTVAAAVILAVWFAALVFVWALCRAAARGDRLMRRDKPAEGAVVTICPGCGEEFTPPTKHPHQRFCSLLCSRPRGPANNRFNGGLCFNRALQRWVIHCRDGSLMYYYRAVMAAEIGRLLRPDEIVHHVNGDPTDDRLENLQILTRAEHVALHRAEEAA